MKEKCVACGYKFVHHHEYHNNEAGILLCQKCSFKVAKHYIKGWQGTVEAEANIAKRAGAFIDMLEQREKE